MPRGGGLTYDYQYLRSCVKDIIEKEMQSGDIFFAETIAFFLTQYQGLSKNDKNKIYTSPLGSLLSSSNYFIVIMNQLVKNNEVRKILRVRVKRNETITSICGRTKSTPSTYYWIID